MSEPPAGLGGEHDDRAIALGRIRRLGGDELVRDMLEIFFTDTPQRLATARDAALAQNAAEVARVTHAIKSSCGQLGLARMRELAEDAELAARASDLGPLPALLEALEHELGTYRVWADDARDAWSRGAPS